jgi:hypothetical protein
MSDAIAIWPTGTTTLEKKQTRLRLLSDIATSQLVDSFLNYDTDIDPELFDQVNNVYKFKHSLQRHLLQRSESPGMPRNAAQLLAFAFADQKHLPWASFRGLSAEALNLALHSPELRNAESISLCLDTVRASTEEIFEILSNCPNQQLCGFYFHQAPTRDSDVASTNLFLRLAAQKPPRFLLKAKKIMISGAFSSSLSRRIWLPTSPRLFMPPFQVYPIQHMFIRRLGAMQYYYLGDALLRPQRFAAGFLTLIYHLRHYLSCDEILNILASAAPTLEDSTDDFVSCRRHSEVSHLAPENRAIPRFPLLDPPEAQGVKCWPQVRDMVPGSWTVLVWVVDCYQSQPIRQPIVKYAFVRPRVTIPCQKLPENSTYGDYLDVVGGLEDFIRETADPEGSVDINLVRCRLGKLARAMGTRQGQFYQPRGGQRWLEQFTSVEAWNELRDVLENASDYGIKALTLAIAERPGGKLVNYLSSHEFLVMYTRS